jgi:transposase
VSGRAILEALVNGASEPAALAELARGQLRGKRAALCEALRGRLLEHHRFQLQIALRQWAMLQELVGQLDQRIAAQLAPWQDALERLDEVPGINRRVAEVVLAEIGPDMGVFPSAAHLASWAGLCPGNNESAGKRYGGRTRKGSRWLRAALTQAGWAAGRTKHSYFGAQYRRLAARRGRKRAALAVGHSLLVSVYYILARGCRYQELGPNYLDQLQPERLTRYLVRRLERLGHKVTLEKVAAA